MSSVEHNEPAPGPGRPKDVRGCNAGDLTLSHAPALVQFLRRSDTLQPLGEGGTEVLVERRISASRTIQMLYATVGHFGQPKGNHSADTFLRADLPKCSTGPRSLLLSGDAVRQYFYRLEPGGPSNSLYGTLGVCQTASPSDLRLAWRVRSLALGVIPTNNTERARIERAFNLLAHPDLRKCYDSLLRDETAPPMFPYKGFGVIVVEGNLAEDGTVFIGHRILSYKPEMSLQRTPLLLRQCDFFADYLVFRDSRRKLEIWIDASLLPGIQWDLTWNHWKRWLSSRIKVDATFVRSGTYQHRNGAWHLRTWHIALPSRIQVTVPDGILADVLRAKAIHALLGEHAEVLEKIRSEVEKQPIEHVQIQKWFDQLSVSTHLKPQHVTWRPDYEHYHFEQLRRRCTTWFLAREEYLFIWASVLISEIPQPGHATYVFAKPDDVQAFMRCYSHAQREDIRRNRHNIATSLGFVGRVVRGQNKKRWLNEVLKLSGLKGDYAEVSSDCTE